MVGGLSANECERMVEVRRANSNVGQNQMAILGAGVSLIAAVATLHSAGFLLGYITPALLRFDEGTRRTISIEVGVQKGRRLFPLRSSARVRAWSSGRRRCQPTERLRVSHQVDRQPGTAASTRRRGAESEPPAAAAAAAAAPAAGCVPAHTPSHRRAARREGGGALILRRDEPRGARGAAARRARPGPNIRGGQKPFGLPRRTESLEHVLGQGVD